MNDKSEFDFETAFPPLGHQEHHFNKYPNHPWITSKKEILEWINKNLEYKIFNKYSENKKVVIHDDYTISFLDPDYDKEKMMVFIRDSVTHMPLQIRFVESFRSKGLKSAIGTPYCCDELILDGCKFLTSFEGMNNNLSIVDLSNTGIKSFHKMPKFNKSDAMLILEENLIESWDGFNNATYLLWWQTEWCDKTSYDLLIKTPKCINKIVVKDSFDSPFIKKKKRTLLNMEWLREEQFKMMIKKQSNEIDSIIAINSGVYNKRKI